MLSERGVNHKLKRGDDEKISISHNEEYANGKGEVERVRKK